MDNEFLKSVIPNLLPGVLLENLNVSPIFGGRNNRAYHVKSDGKEYFLKHYNNYDALNRLEAEYCFLEHATICGSLYTVKPIACDKQSFFALYEYKVGEKYQVNDVNLNEINHALTFLFELNEPRFSKNSCNLSNAREACFAISDHISRIDERVKNLETIEIIDEIDKQTVLFIEVKLKPAWLTIKNAMLEQFLQHNVVLNSILSQSDKVISPSDFGFHNALKLPNNQTLFVDFEYAGWDDPAKLIGDFFNQIEVPVSMEFFSFFSKSLSGLVKNKQEMLCRARILFPAYCIKWCCIILNYFLPKRKIDKSFSIDITKQVRHEQLVKAKKHFDRLQGVWFDELG